MDEDKYSEGVEKTWKIDFKDVTPHKLEVAMAAMGIAGEAGEVVDMLKKYVFHNVAIDKMKLVKELGDLRYYYTACLNVFDLDDSLVKSINHDKLKARYPGGFQEGGGKRDV